MITSEDTAKLLHLVSDMLAAKRENRRSDVRNLRHKIADWAITHAAGIAFEIDALGRDVLIHLPECPRFVEGDMVLFDGIYNCPDCRKKSAERRQEAMDWLMSGKAFAE